MDGHIGRIRRLLDSGHVVQRESVGIVFGGPEMESWYYTGVVIGAICKVTGEGAFQSFEAVIEYMESIAPLREWIKLA